MVSGQQDIAVEPGDPPRPVARRLPAVVDRVEGRLRLRRPDLEGAYQSRRPFWGASAALCGLVVAIAAAGLVGLTSVGNVRDTAEGALRDDIAIQDAADDVLVSILEVRHAQRNIAFGGVTSDRIVRYEDEYSELIDDIDELERLGIANPSLTQPADLKRMAIDYKAVFDPALALSGEDPGFIAASDEGIRQLAALQRSAQEIDVWAEEEGELAIARVADSSADARLILFIVIGGLILIGGALVYAAYRVLAEHRRLYQAEQAASAQLTEALQAKNDFIADASHELRTPLTVLRGNAEAGLLIDADCPHREILEDIVDESSMMTRLVEDLLFLARSDAAPPPLQKETRQVEGMLDALAERAQTLVAQQGATFSTALTAVGAVEVDPGRIEQALMALVDNAAKYSPQGSRVQLSSQVREGSLVIDVDDQGPGIAEADLERVFERFFRTDRARSRRLGGTGLGLPIARTIVEAHDGTIEAVSRPGHGTRMRVTLPLATTPSTGRARKESEAPLELAAR